MSISTIGAVGAILYMNVINSQNMTYDDNVALADHTVLPYFRGFYDVVKAPFQSATVLILATFVSVDDFNSWGCQMVDANVLQRSSLC